METTNNAKEQVIDEADLLEAAEIFAESPSKEKTSNFTDDDDDVDDASVTPSELEQAAAATFSPMKEKPRKVEPQDEDEEDTAEAAAVVDSSMIEAELQQEEEEKQLAESPVKTSTTSSAETLLTPLPKNSKSSSKNSQDASSEVEIRFLDEENYSDSDDEDGESEDDDGSDDDDATQPETPEKFEDEEEDFQNDDQDGLKLRTGSPSPRKKSIKVNLEEAELGKVQNKKKKSKKNSKKTASQKSKNGGKKDSKTKSSKSGKRKSKTSSKKKHAPTNNRRRFRCKIIVCFILSLFLMACIAILGYTLYSVRNDQEPSFFGIDITQKFQEWFNRENGGSSDGDNTSSSNTPPKPSHTADPELMAMVRDSLLFATGASTGAALPAGVGDFNVILDQPNSLQFAVLAWLANDPFLFDYSAQKMLQRYVLGCFYWSLQDLDMDSKMLDTWMTYEDECEMWHTTNTEMPFCDANGNVVSIHLENVGLKGLIAPELALLSNSLELLYLTENKVKGTLPPAIGHLTNLKRVQLSRNNLSGELPTQLGNLHERLEVLSLGHNAFTGAIPSQITKLANLIELNLSNNNLSGEVPTGVIELAALSTLRLEENNVVGAMPDEMCNRTSISTNETLEISLDCEQIQCSCCKGCCFYCGLGGDDDESTGDEGANSATETTAVSPTTSPTLDPFAYPIVAQIPATNNDCYAIQTGFNCYNPQFAIDFESSTCNPQAADMVAMFTELGGPKKGTQRPLTDAVLWATSCNLDACDGVVSEGMIYYRNLIPERLRGAPSWPLAVGSYFLAAIQVDASGMATILANSEPFSVAAQCPQ
ncbi:MAG: hypothetical protein SGILL_002993 [Bacillariaceae sp.]